MRCLLLSLEPTCTPWTSEAPARHPKPPLYSTAADAPLRVLFFANPRASPGNPQLHNPKLKSPSPLKVQVAGARALFL